MKRSSAAIAAALALFVSAAVCAAPRAKTPTQAQTQPQAQPDPENATGLERAKIGDPQAVITVFFALGSAELSPGAREILNAAARQLAGDSAAITVGGHTDGLGESHYNQNLSDRRAQVVRSYLITHGVGAERLTAVGYGKSQPMDSNATEQGRAHNRRVVLKLSAPPG